MNEQTTVKKTIKNKQTTYLKKQNNNGLTNIMSELLWIKTIRNTRTTTREH